MMVLEKISVMFSLTVVGIVLFLVISSTGTCMPAEEGEEHNISWSHSSSSYISKMHWEVYFQNGTTVVLTNCTDVGNCTSYFPDYFDVSNTEKNRAILTIKEMSRNTPFDMETVRYWRAYSWGNRYVVCSPMEIFVRPKPVCEQPRLIASEFSVEVNCSSERTYPAPKCQALISKNNDSFSTVETIYSESQPYDESGVEYYTATCSFTLSLGQFETHGQYLKIKMYPNLNSISNDEDYGDDSDVFDIASLLVTDYGDSTAHPDNTGDNNDGDDDNTGNDDNNDGSDDSSLALGLGIPLAIMIVLAVALAVVLAVMLYRRKHALGKRRPLTIGPPMTRPEPVPENYDSVDMASPRQGSEIRGHNYQQFHAHNNSAYTGPDQQDGGDTDSVMYLNEDDVKGLGLERGQSIYVNK